MKTTKILLSALITIVFSMTAFSQAGDRLVSSKSHIKFFSTTPAEDIEANNYTSTSTIDTSNGNVVFTVPMQGFEFPKALMQRHFNNSDFLDTKQFPNARFVGKIANLDQVDFSANGTYNAQVEGEMTIKGVTKPIRENGTITVNGNSFEINSKFNLTLADYGVEFVRGKPASNIAKTVAVTFVGEYQKQ